MRVWLILIFCGMKVCMVRAQSPQPRVPDYLPYYKGIALAEKAITDSRYAEAIAAYRNLFRSFPYNNPADCYVAAQVSAYISDTMQCLDFLYNGISFGLPLATIRSNPHLAAIFLRVRPEKADSCITLYRKRINPEAREGILALIRCDQQYIRNHPYGPIYERHQHRERLRSAYVPVWDSLVRQLILLTAHFGFPAQKIAGTQDGTDSLFRPGPIAVWAHYPFIHHGNAWRLFSDEALQQLHSGNLTPQAYGVLFESDRDNPPLYYAARPCQDRKCRQIIRIHKASIDSARGAIGLCTYEVMERKFRAMRCYRQWSRKQGKGSAPCFDFQCELSFQGK